MSYLRVLCILVFVALSFADPQPKQLAGPPEDFTLYRIPDPVEAALNQKTAFLHTRFLKVKQFFLRIAGGLNFFFKKGWKPNFGVAR